MATQYQYAYQQENRKLLQEIDKFNFKELYFSLPEKYFSEDSSGYLKEKELCKAFVKCFTCVAFFSFEKLDLQIFCNSN